MIDRFKCDSACVSERRGTSHHWSQAVRAHHACPTGQLHWLPPVRRRVEFKLSTLVYRSFAGTAPAYLAVDCMLDTATGRRQLWSADSRTCMVKKSLNQFGDCCFATSGPTLWNSLSEQLRQPDITFGQFKRSLKKFMFGLQGRGRVLRAPTKIFLSFLLTYLLAYSLAFILIFPF